MPVITDKPLEKVLLRLYKEDLAVLRQIYGPSNKVNEIIRTVVHTWTRKALEATTNVTETPE